jgi:hypothetical protein
MGLSKTHLRQTQLSGLFQVCQKSLEQTVHLSLYGPHASNPSHCTYSCELGYHGERLLLFQGYHERSDSRQSISVH